VFELIRTNFERGTETMAKAATKMKAKKKPVAKKKPAAKKRAR
jgi:hypothetical protein